MIKAWWCIFALSIGSSEKIHRKKVSWQVSGIFFSPQYANKPLSLADSMKVPVTTGHTVAVTFSVSGSQETGSCCYISCPSKTHWNSTLMEFTHKFFLSCSTIPNNTRQWYCCVICKNVKWLDKWNGCSEPIILMRFEMKMSSLGISLIATAQAACSQNKYTGRCHNIVMLPKDMHNCILFTILRQTDLSQFYQPYLLTDTGV